MGTNPGATGESWPGEALCRPWSLREAREGLERNLLGGEGGRERERGDTHRAAGRRESPEAVNPAG